jgi:hypothetical protein
MASNGGTNCANLVACFRVEAASESEAGNEGEETDEMEEHCIRQFVRFRKVSVFEIGAEMGMGMFG